MRKFNAVFKFDVPCSLWVWVWLSWGGSDYSAVVSSDLTAVTAVTAGLSQALSGRACKSLPGSPLQGC